MGDWDWCHACSRVTSTTCRDFGKEQSAPSRSCVGVMVEMVAEMVMVLVLRPVSLGSASKEEIRGKWTRPRKAGMNLMKVQVLIMMRKPQPQINLDTLRRKWWKRTSAKIGLEKI